jgi:hypothetical protein
MFGKLIAWFESQIVRKLLYSKGNFLFGRPAKICVFTLLRKRDYKGNAAYKAKDYTDESNRFQR